MSRTHEAAFETAIEAHLLNNGYVAVHRNDRITLAEIGRFASGRGVRLRLPGGRSLPSGGYDQLAGRSRGR